MGLKCFPSFFLLPLTSSFVVSGRPAGGGRILVIGTSKEERDIPDLSLLHLVAFGGGLCGGGMCALLGQCCSSLVPSAIEGQLTS